MKLLAVNISEMTLEKLLNGSFFFSFIKKISCQTGSDTFFFCQTIGLKSCRINLWGETVITHFLCFLLSQIISRSSVFHHHFYLLNWSKSWTSLYMDGTAVNFFCDLLTWGGNLGPKLHPGAWFFGPWLFYNLKKFTSRSI